MMWVSFYSLFTHRAHADELQREREVKLLALKNPAHS